MHHLCGSRTTGSLNNFSSVKIRKLFQPLGQLGSCQHVVVICSIYGCVAGIVRFAGRQDPDAVLNKWSSNISKLLDCVEKASQQIQKESMVHRVPIGNTN